MNQITEYLDSQDNTLLFGKLFDETVCKEIMFHSDYQSVVNPSNTILCGLTYVTICMILYIFNDKIVISEDNKFAQKCIWYFKILYNLVQIVVCSWMTLNFGSIYFYDFGFSHPPDEELEWVAIVFYYTKILDFVDTFLILITGKLRQFTFLHVFHHSTMPWHVGNVLRCGKMHGIVLHAPHVNSFIHVLLYLHYFVRTIGLNHPYSKFITTAQLAQFVFLQCRAWLGLYMIPHLRDFALEEILYQAFMFFLFHGFYQQRYKKSKKKRA